MRVFKPAGLREITRRANLHDIKKEFQNKYPEKIDIMAPNFRVDMILDESEARIYGSCLDDMAKFLVNKDHDPIKLLTSLSERGTFNRVKRAFNLLIAEIRYFLLEKYKKNSKKG